MVITRAPMLVQRWYLLWPWAVYMIPTSCRLQHRRIVHKTEIVSYRQKTEQPNCARLTPLPVVYILDSSIKRVWYEMKTALTVFTDCQVLAQTRSSSLTCSLRFDTRCGVRRNNFHVNDGNSWSLMTSMLKLTLVSNENAKLTGRWEECYNRWSRRRVSSFSGKP